MPINSYQVMRVFTHDAEDYEVHQVRKALEDFRLFAFVIHDPEEHAELHQKLDDSFDRLDYLTGHKLLFFALVDPPESWSQHAKRRPYVDTVNHLARELQRGYNQSKTSDPAASALGIAKSLELTADDLPAIIVTPNFGAKAFIHLATNADCIEEQLQTIGMVADRTESTNPEALLDEVATECDRIEGCQTFVVDELSDAMASRLADWLAIIGAHGGGPVGQQARKHSTRVIRRLAALVKQYKQQDNSDSKLQQVSEAMILMLGIFEPHPASDEAMQHWCISPSDLEFESCTFLRTGYRVGKLLSAPPSPLFEQSLITLDDWSPLAISLAKAFENEVNLSFVHWIREHAGVTLPQFFKIHQPGLRARYNGVDFNDINGRTRKWKAPELGKSLNSTRQLSSTTPLPQPLMPNDWAFIEQRWTDIHQIRNRAAHPESVSKIDASDLANAIQDLGRANAFEKMAAMKRKYRGY